MNEKVIEILEKPLGVKLGILVGSVALIGAGLWYFLIADNQTQLAEINTAIDDLKGQISEKKAIAHNLPRFEEEVKRLDIELNKALSELPDAREIDDLLSRISDRARDAGLEIRSFLPIGERRQDFYAAVPVELEVLGTYHQIATFFDEVAHLNRIVNVEDYAMAKPEVGDTSVQIETKALITSFRFLDESERAPVEEPKSKKRKRKSKSEEE